MLTFDKGPLLFNFGTVTFSLDEHEKLEAKEITNATDDSQWPWIERCRARTVVAAGVTVVCCALFGQRRSVVCAAQRSCPSSFSLFSGGREEWR